MFILAYVLASVTLAPAFLLTFAAGAVFGLLRGTLLVYVGAVLGSSTGHIAGHGAAIAALLDTGGECGGNVDHLLTGLEQPLRKWPSGAASVLDGRIRSGHVFT